MMIAALLALGLLALGFGLALGYAAIRFHVEGDPLVEQIDQVLPQTQCGQCVFVFIEAASDSYPLVALPTSCGSASERIITNDKNRN